MNAVIAGPEALDRHIAVIEDDLSVAFPDVDPAVVSSLVARCRRSFEGARVRDFVAVLVARHVRAELLALTERPANR